MRRFALTVLLARALALTVSDGATSSTHGTGHQQFPEVISLPNGFQPEGISAGRGTSFYVGSLVAGAIYRGDVRTGRGAVLIPGQPGRIAAGTEVDKRNRLFVAGASAGTGRVYDAQLGVGDLLVMRDGGGSDELFLQSADQPLYARWWLDGNSPRRSRRLPAFRLAKPTRGLPRIRIASAASSC